VLGPRPCLRVKSARAIGFTSNCTASPRIFVPWHTLHEPASPSGRARVHIDTRDVPSVLNPSDGYSRTQPAHSSGQIVTRLLHAKKEHDRWRVCDSDSDMVSKSSKDSSASEPANDVVRSRSDQPPGPKLANLASFAALAKDRSPAETNRCVRSRHNATLSRAWRQSSNTQFRTHDAAATSWYADAREHESRTRFSRD
jgi:hypothetical protein